MFNRAAMRRQTFHSLNYTGDKYHEEGPNRKQRRFKVKESGDKTKGAFGSYPGQPKKVASKGKKKVKK